MDMLKDVKKDIEKQYKENIKNMHDNFENAMLDIFKNKLGMSEEGYRSVIFISMLIYYCEKSLEQICSFIIKKGVISPVANEGIEYIFEELTFMSKIKVYEKLLKKYPTQYKDLIKEVSFYSELNGIRNQLFHCKFNKILYKGKSITGGEAKVLLVEDLVKACGLDTEKNVPRRVLASEAFDKNK